MYLYYKKINGGGYPQLPDNVEIVRYAPSFKKGRFIRFVYLTSWIYRLKHRVLYEYDVVKDNKVVSRSLVMSKIPIYRFMPRKGIHLGLCFTIPEERGKGYYPLMLKYIQADLKDDDVYMIVDERNVSSIKGIEKAGFVKFAKGEKNKLGIFIITEYFNG